MGATCTASCARLLPGRVGRPQGEWDTNPAMRPSFDFIQRELMRMMSALDTGMANEEAEGARAQHVFRGQQAHAGQRAGGGGGE